MTVRPPAFVVPLRDARATTCGGKATALGTLLRVGMPVPDGFVLPFATYLDAVRDLNLGHRADEARQMIETRRIDDTLIELLRDALDDLDTSYVAVRSSAANEDTGRGSAAGQYESFLAIHGVAEVADAVRACWASLFSSRAIAYRADNPADNPPTMAVIVQRHVDADISGVMFTPSDPDDPTEIEASWGLGLSTVGGTVTPDAYRVAADGTVVRTIADKMSRLDRDGARIERREVAADLRRRPTIDDSTAVRLAEFGKGIAGVLDGPQDIEWAIVDEQIWVLQARPVTVALPTRRVPPPGPSAPETPAPETPAPEHRVLSGTPGSHGVAIGPARIVRGPGDFSHVQPGDILVCPFTDPAWTPLLRIASGVVTETGGMLSHAAIVARELAIPAVLGVADATNLLADNTDIAIDGHAGTVALTTS